MSTTKAEQELMVVKLTFDEIVLLARAEFVKHIKDENFMCDRNQSIRQHWSGPLAGFADYSLQLRWNDYLEGFQDGIQQAKGGEHGN